MTVCLPVVIAEAYARGWLPRRAASSLFHRSARRLTCYQQATVERTVRFGQSRMQLSLPLRFVQNWTILFENFDRYPDGLCLAVFSSLCRNARVVVDVGMNAGLYMYHALAYAPRIASVIGFEPNVELANMVRQNIERNGYELAKIEPLCCSDFCGVSTLYESDTDHMASLEPEFLPAMGRPILRESTTDAVTLDAYMSQASKRPDVMKIDVEGHEPAVLRGAARCIRESQPAIILEMIEPSDGILEEMNSLGYQAHYVFVDRLLPITSAAELFERRFAGYVNYVFTAREEHVRMVRRFE